jgi:hypothetical protein
LLHLLSGWYSFCWTHWLELQPWPKRFPKAPSLNTMFLGGALEFQYKDYGWTYSEQNIHIIFAQLLKYSDFYKMCQIILFEIFRGRMWLFNLHIWVSFNFCSLFTYDKAL